MSDTTDAAEAGTRAWKYVVTAQRVATPDHGDFYALAGEVVGTLFALGQLARVLAGQVGAYGEGRELRDDAGGDPARRVAMATARLEELARLLGHADWVAGDVWSEVGHIGLVEPAEVETGEG